MDGEGQVRGCGCGRGRWRVRGRRGMWRSALQCVLYNTNSPGAVGLVHATLFLRWVRLLLHCGVCPCGWPGCCLSDRRFSSSLAERDGAKPRTHMSPFIGLRAHCHTTIQYACAPLPHTFFPAFRQGRMGQDSQSGSARVRLVACH